MIENCEAESWHLSKTTEERRKVNQIHFEPLVDPGLGLISTFIWRDLRNEDNNSSIDRRIIKEKIKKIIIFIS